MKEKLFPTVLMILDICAAAMYIQSGDQRYFNVKCPHCGVFPLVMNVGRRPTSGEYVSVCSECQKEIRENIHETAKD